MRKYFQYFSLIILIQLGCVCPAVAQKNEKVKVVKSAGMDKIDVFVGNKLFTSFLFPDTLEKPVLYPVYAAGGSVVTRGFPINPQPGDPTDHPHHLGIWLNFENVNGLDFWNNSYAIPQEKKHQYGWIRTKRIVKTSGGSKGVIVYQADWTNQQKDVLIQENTRLEFSGDAHRRIIDRVTTLKAMTDVLFKDAKDGMIGMRLAHALQIPSKVDEKFRDDKGNVTIVKGGTDLVANGNYLTSEGKTGDDAWGTRARWCKVYGKIGNDSVSVTIMDHPGNIDYPTYWHARGYGLFAANPLGKEIFSHGQGAIDLHLKEGDSVTFRYRILVDDNDKTISPALLNQIADEFAKTK